MSSQIELYPHNQIAYDKLCDMLAHSDRACVIQPTGTGKFVIIAKLVQDNSDKRFLLLGTNDYMFIDQMDNLEKIAPGFHPDNLQFRTYASAMSMARDEQISLKYDYIILDEFHHCGAPEWSKGVQWVIDAKKCYEIVRGAGMTALIKPVREKIDIENLITDYENGMTLNELASKYDSSYAYIRRLTSSCRGNPKPKLLSDDEKREIIRLHGDGMTVTAIARSIGRSSTAVAKVLRQNGLETDLRVPKQTIAQAETLIREGNKSYREIATLLGMSPSNVSRVARTISAVPNYKHNAKKVLCVESGEVFSSASEAQRCLSTPNSGGVSAACRSGKKYKGCHWKYVDDEDDR